MFFTEKYLEKNLSKYFSKTLFNQKKQKLMLKDPKVVLVLNHVYSNEDPRGRVGPHFLEGCRILQRKIYRNILKNRLLQKTNWQKSFYS